MDYPNLALLIGNRRVEAAERDTLDVINPADGSVLAGLPIATTADLDEALSLADKAFETWRRMAAFDRATILMNAADLLRQRAADIGRITTLEQGKPLAESIGEVHGAAGILDWFAEESRRSYGRVVPAKVAERRDLVLRMPVGPVAAFTPWNFPITIPSRKIGASLAAGCTCIIKPAEETPGTALALAQALIDAGLPDGVLSVVFGDPDTVSTHLIRSPLIRKVTFTGSTAVGKHIASLAAEGVKRLTLELGGHAPVLIFDDADLDAVVQRGSDSKYRNAGQVCISPTRFYVQEGVYDEVVRRFAEAASVLPVGSGLDPATRMGPLAHGRRPPAIESMVQDAVDKGARVLTGGSARDGAGYFWEPTVLADVDPSSRAMNEEPFGPVALMAPFKTFDEAIASANRLPYGLAAYAFTTSLKTAHDLSESVETGMLGVNHFMLTGPETPFGGVKESGYGSEGGSEGLDDFLFSKLVSQL
jgi:succinate-semialdehyde dehydrogenase/glutarate-semialdehyde dehydrogenase